MAYGTHSYGTALQLDATDTNTWVTVAGVYDLTAPDLSMETSENTDLNSTSATKTVVAGLIEVGELSAKTRWHKTTYSTLLALFAARTNSHWRIYWPSGAATETFYGYITKIGKSFPAGDQIDVDITIKASGTSTFA